MSEYTQPNSIKDHSLEQTIEELADLTTGVLKLGYNFYKSISLSRSLDKTVGRWVKSGKYQGFLNYREGQGETGYFIENEDKIYLLEYNMLKEVEREPHPSDLKHARRKFYTGLLLGAGTINLASAGIYPPLTLLVSIPLLNYSAKLVIDSVKERFLEKY